METIKKNYEFRYILQKGKYYSGDKIEIFITKNNKNINYIGIAIGVKIAKAVKRNHIKRLIRENYRLIENKLDKGYNMIFLWKKKNPVSEATFYNIQNDMKNIFKKSGILKND